MFAKPYFYLAMVAALAMLLGATSVATADGYDFTLLGVSDAGDGFPSNPVTWEWDVCGTISINDSGQIAGFYHPAGISYKRAFLYSGGTLTDLGTLGGDLSAAQDINSSGQIVGIAEDSSYDVMSYLYSGGTMTTLSGIDTAIAINDIGQIAGRVGGSACLYNGPGSVVDIGASLGEYNYLTATYDVNNNGIAVGYGYASGYSAAVGFVYDSNTDSLTTLSVSGQDLAVAMAVNDSGLVVGGYGFTEGLCTWQINPDGSVSEATIIAYDNSDFPYPAFYDLNEVGVMVGYAYSSDYSETTAVAYVEGVGVFDLNDLIAGTAYEDWTLIGAMGINESNIVVGYAIDGNGNYDAYTIDLTDAMTIPGDANKDGVVDISDLTVLSLNWEDASEDKTWEQGDFDGDGYVDISDLTTLSGHWTPGGSSYSEALASIGTVPEPTTFAMLIAGLVGLVAYAWRKR